MKATVRVIFTTLIFVVAIAFAFKSVAARNPTPELLSEHSHPAVSIPEQPVAIVQGGKTFHDPKCAYLHGEPEMVSAQEAVNKGYAPCVRCMRQALTK
jgi:hypothetical protein